VRSLPKLALYFFLSFRRSWTIHFFVLTEEWLAKRKSTILST